MPKKLLFPEDARAWLRRRFDHQHRRWLSGGGTWPLSVTLGNPAEKLVAEDPGSVRGWVEAWSQYRGGGELLWVERQWPHLGEQRLPERLSLPSALELAQVVGETVRYQRAAERYARLVQTWPALQTTAQLARHFEVLADYPEQDFRRLWALLTWLVEHPSSGLYLRQLPVEGMDTKWIDSKRRAVVTDLVQGMRQMASASDFYDLCGLRRAPHRVRLRLLCPRLRESIGGLGDIEAPIDQLAHLRLTPERVIIVENLETGIALPDLAGSVAFMKLGHAVSVLAAIPWLQNIEALYWGDIDTHGFAILDRARTALPRLRSVLMDEATLLAQRALWGQEQTPYPEADLPRLTPNEHAVFDGLRANVWGQGVRLEQERIPWPAAMAALREALQFRFPEQHSGFLTVHGSDKPTSN
jgi:hypothetical protein